MALPGEQEFTSLSSGISVILSIGGNNSIITVGLLLGFAAFVTFIIARDQMYVYTLNNPF